MSEWLLFQRGIWRIHWGFCPVCNSDAPELDSCRFCDGFRGWRNKPARMQLIAEWQMFTNHNKGALRMALDRQIMPWDRKGRKDENT